MNKLEELIAWQKARELRKEISKLSEKFPPEEKYRLKDQIIRSSRSVSANIAEGYGRYQHLDNMRFCRNARGSLLETLDHLFCGLDENIIDLNDFNRLNNLIEEEIKIINGYMIFLKKAKNDSDKKVKKN